MRSLLQRPFAGRKERELLQREAQRTAARTMTDPQALASFVTQGSNRPQMGPRALVDTLK